MKLSQFKFKLPEEQIAQYPAKNRDESPVDGNRPEDGENRTSHF